MLVYSGGDLILIQYIDSDFQLDRYCRKSTFGTLFTLESGAILWRSVKQTCIAYSTMEAGYVAGCEVTNEVVWLRDFLRDLEVVPEMHEPIKFQ